MRTITATVKKKKGQQLAHKLCLMNFNDAFCSYLFGEMPITINAGFDSFTAQTRQHNYLLHAHNIEKKHADCTETLREYIKLSYFNQIWINSMHKGNKKTGNKSVTDNSTLQ